MDRDSKDLLPLDRELTFPHCILLKASAGSGKTHALTKRYVQFLLSERIKNNTLLNILAITFSNNAAKEMKQRIIRWLKELSLEIDESINAVKAVTTVSSVPLPEKAGHVLNQILQNYSDFNVKTIDSFMTSLFRASAVELAIDPDFEIMMDETYIFEYAMQKCIREMGLQEAETATIERVIDTITDRDGAFPWNPAVKLLKEMTGLYRKSSSLGVDLESAEQDGLKESLLEEIRGVIRRIRKVLEDSGLQLKKRSSFGGILELPEEEIRDEDVLKIKYNTVPVKRPSRNSSEVAFMAFEEVERLWEELKEKVSELALLYSLGYYNPYTTFFRHFMDELDRAKKLHNRILIGDINYHLSRYIDRNIVPDIYMKLGDRISHYLIDEFQDTSPIQWRNLYPLIENALSENGSLFVVGDIKQSIYGFRDADYRIMKSLEEEGPLPSVVQQTRHLNTNYRSHEEILNFAESIFKKRIHDTTLREAASATGLLDYIQQPREDFRGKGFVDFRLIERNNEEPEERRLLEEIIQDLLRRGYRYGDIAILTRDNYSVTQISTWLNEAGVTFASYSSLDIRKRCITRDIKNLLRFLDSPLDDFSFCKFLLGDIFGSTLREQGLSSHEISTFIFNANQETRDIPLYKRFQEAFPGLWSGYFEDLFRKVGYMPVYDLLCDIIKTFSLFSLFKEEESTLIKLLDSTVNYEGKGINNLKDFITLLEDSREDAEWTILLPDNNNAVRVMTIHKAKGLGFPVVILLLYGERLNRGIPYLFSETTEGTYLLKVNSGLAEKNHTLERLYEFEKKRNIANHLNTLYVALTRAERELYILAVKGRGEQFPFNILPEGSIQYGSRQHVSRQGEAASGIEEHPFYCGCIFNRFVEKTGQPLSYYEKKRGIIIHELLARVRWYDPEGVERVLSEYRANSLTGQDRAEVRKMLLGCMSYGPVREYFQMRQGREVFVEADFVDKKGNLYRMDRVVVDPERVTVMDFKTGREHEDALDSYRRQIGKYMEILRDIYGDRQVQGIIYFLDIPDVVILKS